MKIAFVAGRFPPLSETPILNQITGLIARGHTVTVFGDRPPDGAPYHESVDHWGLLAQTRYRPDLPTGNLQRWRRNFALLRSADQGERAVLLRAMNVLRFGNRASSGRLMLQAMQFLPPEEYHIIQAGFGEQGLKALRMKRIGAIKGALVTAFRGADLTRYLKIRGSAAYRGLFRRGDLFLPVSNNFARRLIALGCPEARIVVHRTGINCRHFDFQPRPLQSHLRLLSVGRLTPKKGLEDGLRAIAILLGRGEVLTYTIIGDGPLRMSLEALAGDMGIARHVSFEGARPEAFVRNCLVESDVLLAPSVTAPDGDEEGIPNVIKEAMAIGRPVVTTRHSGIPELVQDGVTGFLADEHDVAGLVRSIELLRAHPDRGPAMRQAARQRIEAEYDIDRLNDRLISLYQAVLNREPPARLA